MAEQRILVVGPSWVGDMVMAQSLFAALKLRYKNAQIDVLAPDWCSPILARMPEVHKAIDMPVGHGQFMLGRRRQVAKQLGQQKYHQAIVLPGSIKSALIPFFANIPRRTGFRGEMRYFLLNDMRQLDKIKLPMTVQRFTALAADAGQESAEFTTPRLAANQANAEALLTRFNLTTNKPIVAMMPGAEYGPAKQWPIKYYHSLAKDLIDDGYQIIVLGSKKDNTAGNNITVGLEGLAFNLSGQTTLGDAIDLLSKSNAAISNDSGLMHVAAALGTPLVAIYGSSTPAHTPPLLRQKQAGRVLYLGIECSPCFARTCPKNHLRCLREISPTEAYAAANEMLATKPRGNPRITTLALGK